MATFRFSRTAIDVASLRAELADPACGGYTSFEGLVRNHNEGLSVRHLEYEAFEPLAVKEGERIVAEAIERFGIERAACVHRIGDLAIGDMAVWVGASARHRDEAFRACRYIIDEVKHRVPIWKKEHYENGDSGWVNCERCAVPTQEQAPALEGQHDHSHGSQHDHAHHHEHAAGHGHEQHSQAHDHASSHASGHDHDHGGDGRQHDHQHTRADILVPDYSRQMALKEVGARGQGKLRASRVLVVGCGGLGVPVISYLAGAGIGRLGLVDGDRLEPSNLHRQTMYALADVGQLKAELASARVRALNPDVDVHTYPVRLDVTTAPDIVGQYDLVIDCTDNFSTKFLLNDVCVQKRVPVIFSSVYQYEGQIQVVRADCDGPCLRCVWPEATRDGIVGNCAEAGVLGPVPGTFGSLQAFEALKLLLDLPGQLGQELLVLDLLTMSISRVRVKRSAACPDHARSTPASKQPQAQGQGHTLATDVVTAAPLEVDFDSLDDARAAGYDIVDIREPSEIAEIPTPTQNAQHIPMAQLLHGTPAFTPTDKTLLVCASGRRSLAATQELRSRGLNAVYSLRGGVTKLNRRVPA
jgi:molybdopterin/thiamine biosynthesis adenylyltransferase/molybdopterin synthase catalytic subunit/rhodanese-related sulfurtransferase